MNAGSPSSSRCCDANLVPRGRDSVPYELAVTDMLASGSAFMLFFLSSYVRGRRHQLEFKDTSRMHPMKTLTLLTPKVLLTGLELKAIFVA